MIRAEQIHQTKLSTKVNDAKNLINKIICEYKFNDVHGSKERAIVRKATRKLGLKAWKLND